MLRSAEGTAIVSGFQGVARRQRIVRRVSSMAGIDNPERMAIAGGVRDRLSVVVEAI